MNSLKFEHIESNLVKLFTLLQSNQNIAKYVYYLVDDPLSKPDVVVDLYEQENYLLTIFDEAIPESEKVRIFLNPYVGSFKNLGIGDISYEMDIVVPKSKWLLKGMGKLRAFCIANEFNKMVDGKPVAGIGNTSIDNFKVFKINAIYSCLSVIINTKTSTLKDGV